jgi:microbial collagenase
MSGQNPPVADAGGPYAGLTFEDIIFDGSKSYDSDGSIVNYTWDFGDGNTSYVKKPVQSYSTQGLFNITLTVIDNDGLTDTDTTTVEYYS